MLAHCSFKYYCAVFLTASFFNQIDTMYHVTFTMIDIFMFHHLLSITIRNRILVFDSLKVAHA